MSRHRRVHLKGLGTVGDWIVPEGKPGQIPDCGVEEFRQRAEDIGTHLLWDLMAGAKVVVVSDLETLDEIP